MPHCVYVPLVRERKFLIFRLNPETGKLSLTDRIDLVAQPYQLCIDPQKRYLYQQLHDDGYSAVASFRIDPSTGGVTQIGEVELETDACYVATDNTGRFLLAAYLIPGMVTVHRRKGDPGWKVGFRPTEPDRSGPDRAPNVPPAEWLERWPEP